MIHPSLVHVKETAVSRSDPQTAIAVPEQPKRIELRSGTWKRIRHDLAVNELYDSAASGDQKCAVVALHQSVDFGGRARQRNEFRSPRLPSPEPGPRSCPESALAILK